MESDESSEDETKIIINALKCENPTLQLCKIYSKLIEEISSLRKIIKAKGWNANLPASFHPSKELSTLKKIHNKKACARSHDCECYVCLRHKKNGPTNGESLNAKHQFDCQESNYWPIDYNFEQIDVQPANDCHKTNFSVSPTDGVHPENNFFAKHSSADSASPQFLNYPECFVQRSLPNSSLIPKDIGNMRNVPKTALCGERNFMDNRFSNVTLLNALSSRDVFTQTDDSRFLFPSTHCVREESSYLQVKNCPDSSKRNFSYQSFPQHYLSTENNNQYGPKVQYSRRYSAGNVMLGSNHFLKMDTSVRNSHAIQTNVDAIPLTPPYFSIDSFNVDSSDSGLSLENIKCDRPMRRRESLV